MKGIILSHQSTFGFIFPVKVKTKLELERKKGSAVSKTARIKTGFRKNTRTWEDNNMKELNDITSIQNTRGG